MRVGMGYDVHRLTEDRKLILGGVEIPYEYGLLGHSDADVLLHAVMDAVLGAAALGDIGKLFPDTDDAYKDASSIRLLENVREQMEEELGDLLFSCVNTARHLQIDAEEALTRATEKFIRRFQKTEELLKQEGIEMQSLGIKELDVYWRRAKEAIR